MGSKHLYNIIFIAAHNYCVGRNRGVFGKLFLKGCLPQNLLSALLNTLCQLMVFSTLLFLQKSPITSV